MLLRGALVGRSKRLLPRPPSLKKSAVKAKLATRCTSRSLDCHSFRQVRGGSLPIRWIFGKLGVLGYCCEAVLARPDLCVMRKKDLTDHEMLSQPITLVVQRTER